MRNKISVILGKNGRGAIKYHSSCVFLQRREKRQKEEAASFPPLFGGITLMRWTDRANRWENDDKGQPGEIGFRFQTYI